MEPSKQTAIKRQIRKHKTLYVLLLGAYLLIAVGAVYRFVTEILLN